MILLVKTKQGAKKVNIKLLNKLYDDGRIPPDARCLSLNQGQTWITIKELKIILGKNQLEETKIQLQDKLSESFEGDLKLEDDAGQSGRKNESDLYDASSLPYDDEVPVLRQKPADPYDGWTKADMGKELNSYVKQHAWDTSWIKYISLLAGLVTAIIYWNMYGHDSAGEKNGGQIFLGFFQGFMITVISAVSLSVSHLYWTRDEEYLQLKQSFRNNKTASRKVTVILWVCFSMTCLFYILLLLMSSIQVSLGISVLVFLCGFVGLIVSLCERLEAGLTTRPAYWSIPFFFIFFLLGSYSSFYSTFSVVDPRQGMAIEMANVVDELKPNRKGQYTWPEPEDLSDHYDTMGYSRPPAGFGAHSESPWLVMWAKTPQKNVMRNWMFLAGRHKTGRLGVDTSWPRGQYGNELEKHFYKNVSIKSGYLVLVIDQESWSEFLDTGCWQNHPTCTYMIVSHDELCEHLAMQDVEVKLN